MRLNCCVFGVLGTLLSYAALAISGQNEIVLINAFDDESQRNL